MVLTGGTENGDLALSAGAGSETAGDDRAGTEGLTSEHF